jgi:ribosomal protein S8E
MALPVRKGYTGNGVQTQVTVGAVSEAAASFNVAAKTGWPTTFPFHIVVDPGTSKEEKMRVTGASGTLLSVDRGVGVDGTSAAVHEVGAVVYPVFTASEADEANKIASVMTTKGDLITNDGSNITRLAVGATNTHVLQVDSTATNGFKWGQVAEAGIADNAVTSAKIAVETIVNADVSPTAAIVYSKLSLSNSIVAGDLTSASVTNAKLNNGVSGDVPLVTVSTSAASGGKNGDVWIVV